MSTDPLIGLTIDFTSFSATSRQERDVEEAPRGGLGSQVLPVADLGDDFEGDPEDGMQYLFLVRREASKHPKINRVANPYEIILAPEAAQENFQPISKPTEQWKQNFLARFTELRKRMNLAPPRKDFPPASHQLPLPLIQDGSGWKTFINGQIIKPPYVKPTPPVQVPTESIDSIQEVVSLEAAKAALFASLEFDSPEQILPIPIAPQHKLLPVPPPAPIEYSEHHPPHSPTPQLILSIPGPNLIRLLSHFDDWLQERLETFLNPQDFQPSTIFAPLSLRKRGAAAAQTTPKEVVKKIVPLKRPPLPSRHELEWILSILTRLNSLLAGDDLSALRILVKTLKQMLHLNEGAFLVHTAEGTPPRTLEEREKDEIETELKSFSWMIVAVVAGIWGQSDLWDE